MGQASAFTTQGQRLTGGLGTPSIVFMVLAAAAPLTVIAGVVPIGFAFGNGVGFPSMFALLGMVLLLFSVGFTTMTRYLTKPGAFFTYIAHGLGRHAGLAAAYAAVLCYMAIEVGVLGYIGFEVNGTIAQYGGPDLHWSIYTALAIAAVGWLGSRHVAISARVLAVLLSLELAIVLLISVVAVARGGADGLDLTSFTPSALTSGAPALGVMFAAAAFIGFEATAIFRDEAHEPLVTVPRATFAAVLLVGFFYTFTSWALVMAWGSNNVVTQATDDPSFLFSTADAQLGSAGEAVTRVLVITSIFAAALAFHAIITRYLHALSRAHTLPSVMSGVSPRDGAPRAASLATTVIASALVVICLAAGLDPYLEVFTWFVGLGALVYILLLMVCSLAVILYFLRRGRQGESLWRVRVAPALALVGLLVSSYITLANFPLLVGDVDAEENPAFGPLSLLLLATIVVVVLVGVVQAGVLRANRRQVYAGITEVDLSEE